MVTFRILPGRRVAKMTDKSKYNGVLPPNWVEKLLIEVTAGTAVNYLRAQDLANKTGSDSRALAIRAANGAVLANIRTRQLLSRVSETANRVDQGLKRRVEPVAATVPYLESRLESIGRYFGFILDGNFLISNAGIRHHLIDANGIKVEDLHKAVLTLHDMGVPFRAIEIGEHADNGMAGHLAWLLRQKINNYSGISGQDWLRLYLETAHLLAEEQIRWSLYLALPDTAISGKSLFGERTLDGDTLLSVLARIFAYPLETSAIVEAALVDEPTFTRSVIFPDRLEFARRIAFTDDNGTILPEFTLSRLRGIKTGNFSSFSALRGVLYGHIGSAENILLVHDIWPVPKNQREPILDVTRNVSAALRRRRIVTTALDNAITAVEDAEAVIMSREAPMFVRESLMVLKTPDEMDTYEADVLETLRLQEIYQEPVKGRASFPLFRRLAPIGPGKPDFDQMVPEPDIAVESLLAQSQIPVPGFGFLVGAYADTTPFVLGGKVKSYLLTGGMGAGKSSLMKLVAWLAAGLGLPVIAVDNAVSPKKKTGVDRTITMKGWVDIARTFGGKIFFADQYAASRMEAALNRCDSSKFMLYYPDERFPEKDLIFLHWVAKVLQDRQDPTHHENDIQQVLLLDDILSWLSSSGDERTRFLAMTVLRIVKGTGTLSMLAVQTPSAIKKADPAAFEMLKAVWESSINFPNMDLEMADSLGIETITARGELLHLSLTEALRGMVHSSFFEDEVNRGAVVLTGNITMQPVKIVIHPEILRVISRMRI